MDDNVVILPVVTTLDVPVERIIDLAGKADLERVFIIGRTKEGDLYFASSVADGGTVLWDMEVAKAKLLGVEVAE